MDNSANSSEAFELEEYFDRLWPINRSLSGEGNRKSLKILSEIIPQRIIEVPSGSECLDWTIPPEWNVRDAWIRKPDGSKIACFLENNLHLVGYSERIHTHLTLSELQPHLHSLPELPSAIPYLCSYYSRQWGFCLSHHERNNLLEGTYEVFIDATHNSQGSMSLGQGNLPGATNRRLLLSTYICHPSMANNELSGPLVTAFLFRRLAKWTRRRHVVECLFAPETIGSIAYLAANGEQLKRDLQAGLVLTTIGDSGAWTFRRSRRGDTLIDRAMQVVLSERNHPYRIEEFDIDGSDERQYCSPGYNLPVGMIARTRYGKYPEYHTSLDDKGLMDFSRMVDTIDMLEAVLRLIDANHCPVNLVPCGEPMLGKRGLHPNLTTKSGTESLTMRAIKWVLNLSDGTNDLIKICERSKLPSGEVLEAVATLEQRGLLASSSD